MSNIIAVSFCGLGIDLDLLDIHNERPDGHYLDEELSTGIFTCISGSERLYFGIIPDFPWKNIYGEMPKDEEAAKKMIAQKLIDYFSAERTRLGEDENEDAEDEEYIPTYSEILSKISYIDDNWIELS